MARPSLWEHTLDILWAYGTTLLHRQRIELEKRWSSVQHALGNSCIPGISLADAAATYSASRAICRCVPANSTVPPRLVRPSCTTKRDPTGYAATHSFVPSPAWLDVVRTCQVKVRRQVAQHAIVEVCPTSNAAISGLGWSFALDMGMPEPGKPALKVRIGTDDPGLLATSLPLERAMLREWYLRCGRSPADVDAWLSTAFSRLPP